MKKRPGPPFQEKGPGPSRLPPPPLAQKRSLRPRLLPAALTWLAAGGSASVGAGDPAPRGRRAAHWSPALRLWPGLRGWRGGSGGGRVGTRAQGGVSEWEGQQKLKQRSAGAGSRGGGGESGGRGRGAEQRGLGHRTEPAPSAGPFLTGRPRAFSAGRREQASSVQVSRWGNRGRGRGHTRGGSGHHPTDPLSPLGGERGLGQDTGCKDSGR